jgi:hypothetical protein
VGSAIGPDQPGAVDGKAHRQILDRHVVHHLVVGALQERGIDRAERAHALRGQAGGKGHGMLFGNAHVEQAIGNALANLSSPVPEGIAAVIAQTVGSTSPRRSGPGQRHWYSWAGRPRLACSPVITSNFCTP